LLGVNHKPLISGEEMNHEQVNEKAKLLYNQSYSKAYRTSDNTAITSENHVRMCNILQSLTTSFDHEISVLDIGCGSGRYFHCIKNAKTLTGIDVSPYMIDEAKNPVKQNEVTISDIDLRCGNIFDIQLSENSFDFVYSLGVLGEHSSFDSFLCDKVHKLLKHNGVFFFTVVDINSILQRKGFKRKIAEIMYPILSPFMKKTLDKRWQTFYMTKDALEDVMISSAFHDYTIDRHVSTSLKWKGAHYECMARK